MEEYLILQQVNLKIKISNLTIYGHSAVAPTRPENQEQSPDSGGQVAKSCGFNQAGGPSTAPQSFDQTLGRSDGCPIKLEQKCKYCCEGVLINNEILNRKSFSKKLPRHKLLLLVT